MALITAAALVLMIVGGLGAGLTAGLFGIGGGIVMVPVLHYLLGFSFPLATVVSLFVIMVNTPFGLWRQHRHGMVLWKHGGMLAIGGIIGVYAGRAARPWLPVAVLKGLFALVMLFAALRMIRGSNVRPHEAAMPWLIPAGILAGFAAHLLGIGGGLLMVPVLVFMGVAIHQAVATSLVAVFTNAAVSSLGDILILRVEWPFAVPLAIGAIVGIRAGVHLANRLHAERLRRVFAGFLALVGTYVLSDAFGWAPAL